MTPSKLFLFAALLGLVAGPVLADEAKAMEAYAEGVSALQEAAAAVPGKRAGAWKRAEARFRKAVELKSDYAEAYGKLGQSLFNQGRVLDAITQFRMAVNIDPRLTEAWSDMGFAYENLGQDEKLRSDEKTLKKLLKGAPGDAKAAYEKAIAVDPVNDKTALARSHNRLGVLLRREVLEAWAAAHPADECGSPPAAAPRAKGKPKGGAPNLAPAMKHLEAAAALRPDLAVYQNDLGQIYDDIGRYASAIAAYDRAVALDPDFAEALSNRGVAWWKSGNWERALADTLRATEVGPKVPAGHYNFAEVVFARVQELRLKEKGDSSVIHLEAQKAIDEYRIVTELDPEFMPGWYGLARAYWGYFDFQRAAETYNRILAMDKKQKRAKCLLKKLQAEQKGLESHVPKQYRTPVAGGK